MGDRTDWENLPVSKGLSCLRAHAAGQRLTPRNRIIGHCCDCMGYYLDGRTDCGVKTCILYPLMPYRADRKKPSAPKQETQNEP